MNLPAVYFPKSIYVYDVLKTNPVYQVGWPSTPNIFEAAQRQCSSLWSDSKTPTTSYTIPESLSKFYNLYNLDPRAGFAVDLRADVRDDSEVSGDTSAGNSSFFQVSGSTSRLIAEWEGQVTEIGSETFEARLRGIFGQGVDGELEEATIPLAEVTGPNRELLAEGALFRLCVSYEEFESGQIRRYTDIVFRHLPAYRKPDIDDAVQRARQRLRELRVE
jgi:hypothetical protein